MDLDQNKVRMREKTRQTSSSPQQQRKEGGGSPALPRRQFDSLVKTIVENIEVSLKEQNLRKFKKKMKKKKKKRRRRRRK